MFWLICIAQVSVVEHSAQKHGCFALLFANCTGAPCTRAQTCAGGPGTSVMAAATQRSACRPPDRDDAYWQRRKTANLECSSLGGSASYE
jgi:hypothetical protein